MIADKILQLIPTDIKAVIGDLPSTAKNVLAIIELDGATNTEYFGPKVGTTIFNPIIKIVIRHSSYEAGYDWAQRVKDSLHRYTDETFMSILLVGSILYLGRTEEKIHVFQITFQTQIKE